MSDKPRNVIIEKKDYCQWCFERLELMDLIDDSTCLECYRILLNAGLTDHEIRNRNEHLEQ